MLEGTKVLDLTRLLPGAYCSLLLSDYGAEVIKIEDLGLGDYLRETSPQFGDMGVAFWELNRNKKSISINLKKEKGKQIFLKLVEEADVLLEGFRPGVMDKLGLGYEDLKKTNGSLIYCSLSGYGQEGPYRHKAGHDINYIGYSGLLSLNKKSGQKPSIPPVQIADLAGGAMMSTIGILMAMVHKMKTNEGQKLDISMLDGTISLMNFLFPSLFMGKVPKAEDQILTGGYACYNVYETKDEKYIAVGALEKKFWTAFCEVMGLDRVWIENQRVVEKQPDMIKELEKQFLSQTQSDWLDLLNQKDTCCSPVLDLADVPSNEQVKARRVFVTETLENKGQLTQIRPAIVSTAQKHKESPVAPRRGEHSEGILRALGYSDQEIELFTNEGVI